MWLFVTVVVLTSLALCLLVFLFLRSILFPVLLGALPQASEEEASVAPEAAVRKEPKKERMRRPWPRSHEVRGRGLALWALAA
jgi:hypothetical protein